MFAKSSLALAVLAVAAQLASAQTPPACLLAVANTYDNPAGVKDICGKSSEVNDKINTSCGDNAQAAKSAFNKICGAAGVTVSLSGPASTSGKAASSTASTIIYTSHSYDESCSCTKATTLTGTAYLGTGVSTATGSAGSGSASATTTAAGSSGSKTSAAGSSSATAKASSGAGDRLRLAGVSLGAVAVAGLAVAL